MTGLRFERVAGFAAENLHELPGSERRPHHGPDQSSSGFGRTLVGYTVAELERHLILETLEHCGGNRTTAAKLLGISLRTLRNKISSYSAAGILIPAATGSRLPS